MSRWHSSPPQLLQRLCCVAQVRFVHEAFRKLRPGVPLAMLHGKMKQGKRLDMFYKFTESTAAVLFATDIAARGLDFPAVDWVVQLDCAEDADTYIHRVGRTARFRAGAHCSTHSSALVRSPVTVDRVVPWAVVHGSHACDNLTGVDSAWSEATVVCSWACAGIPHAYGGESHA